MNEPITVNLVGLAGDLDLPSESVSAVVELLNDDNPIPFIARYRKDATGNMNEDQIRAIAVRYNEQKLLNERKTAMLRTLKNAEQLTPDLEKKIRSARSASRLADLYLPYKQSQQSPAAAARRKGLQPLADAILAGKETDLNALAAPYVDPEKKIATVEEALRGAGCIISEQFGVAAELRQKARNIFERTGRIISQKAETEKEGSAAAEVPSKSPIEKTAEEKPEVKGEVEAPAEPVEEPEPESGATQAAAESPAEKAVEEKPKGEGEVEAPAEPVAEPAPESGATQAVTESPTEKPAEEKPEAKGEVKAPAEPVAEPAPESGATQAAAESPAEKPAEEKLEVKGEIEAPAEPVAEPDVAQATAESPTEKPAEEKPEVKGEIEAPAEPVAEPEPEPGVAQATAESPTEKPAEEKPEVKGEVEAPAEPVEEPEPESGAAQATAESPTEKPAEEKSEAKGEVEVPAEPVAEPEPELGVAQAAAESPTESVAQSPTEESAATPAEKAPTKRSSSQSAEKEKKNLAAEQRRLRKEKLYSDYFNFSSLLQTCPGYRILALHRGTNEHRLKVTLSVDVDRIKKEGKHLLISADHPHRTFLEGCFDDAIDRLLLPSLEREVRRNAVDRAREQAMEVYARNTRSLLLQKPLFRRRVLAIAPGFRYGCKLVTLDEFGNLLSHETVYTTGSTGRRKRTIAKIAALIEKYKISVIAIGNGVGRRETEKVIIDMIAEHFTDSDIGYTFVNAADASVYSVSPIAAQEFPNQDVMIRSAISIGRRLQDPLNELVKIDPSHMGVGIYQHDTRTKDLKKSLAENVASAVNYVGVDLNTATSSILRYVAGLNRLTAKRIADYRRKHGPFRSRRELLNVPEFGTAAFAHAAGFLKISDGDEPLDATWIHPESYELAEKILEKAGFCKDDLRNTTKQAELIKKLDSIDPQAAAEEFGAGRNTIADILEQLKRPGRDPREELPAPIFKKGIMKIEDLMPGMELKGTVLNVVDFGAFVDIGLHNPGLIHVSRMGDRYVRDAYRYLSVGDIVNVWVVDTDVARNRISLSMRPPGAGQQSRPRGDRKGRGGREETVAGEENKGPRARRRPRSARGRGGENVPPQPGTSENRPGDRRDQSARSRGEDRQGNNRRQRPPRRDRFENSGSPRGRHNRSGGPRAPRSMNFVSKLEKKETLSQEMKEGKEPLRSFGDLARLFSEKSEKQEDTRREGPE